MKKVHGKTCSTCKIRYDFLNSKQNIITPRKECKRPDLADHKNCDQWISPKSFETDPFIERSIEHESMINAVQNAAMKLKMYFTHDQAQAFISALREEKVILKDI